VPDPHNVLSMEIAAGPLAPSRARMVARRRLTGSLSEQQMEDLLLIVSEMVTLGLTRGAPEAGVGVRVDRRGTGLRVEVRAGAGSYGGLGMEVIHTLSDRAGLTGDVPVTLWAELDLT
jgi:hypothetical protein